VFHFDCQLKFIPKREDFPMDSSQHQPQEDDPKLAREPVTDSVEYRGPVIQSDPSGHLMTYTYYYDPEPSLFQIEHDREKRRFEVTGPDGKKTEFHDRAVRFLVVEPDAETGELEPVVARGKPKVIYLCREAGL
jgi:hypothetical protein